MDGDERFEWSATERRAPRGCGGMPRTRALLCSAAAADGCIRVESWWRRCQGQRQWVLECRQTVTEMELVPASVSVSVLGLWALDLCTDSDGGDGGASVCVGVGFERTGA